MNPEIEIYVEKPVARSMSGGAMADGTDTITLDKVPDLAEMVENGAVAFILPIRRRGYFLKAVNTWIFKILVMIYELSQSGIKGDPGAKGDKGENGDIPFHKWLNTSLAFEKPDGTLGDYVDLKGQKGDAGISALTTGTSGTTVTLPLIALGATYFFDVAVAGAKTNMCAVVNPPPSLLSNLSFWNAVIIENDKVRVYLKAGIAIAAGQKTFHLRVIQ